MTHINPIVIADDVDLSLKSKAGAVDILKRVSLSVTAGQAIGVVGPSGSGKSSLLSILAGLEKPTSGRVIVNGTDLTQLSEDELARFRRQNIGFVFQAFHLIPTMTALENAALPLELANRKDAFQAAQTLLETVGLGARVDHYPDQLSGGEQQRVAIVRAVIAKPPIILADEPTGNLDQAAGGFVADMLFDLQRETGAALILVTHDHSLAKRCQYVVHMKDGCLDDPDREQTPLQAAQ